jgi:hypothetical protein
VREPPISGVAYPLQVLRLWLIIAMATRRCGLCLGSFVRSPAILNATDSGSVKGAGLWESTVRPGSMPFRICLCIAFVRMYAYNMNVLYSVLLMGGQTDKHRLSLSIDSELWSACSEISRQTGMNWSRVAAEAFSLYVRYFAPRDSVQEVETGEEIEQLKPLSEAIQHFNGGGTFRVNPAASHEVLISVGSEFFVTHRGFSLLSPTDIPLLSLVDDMPYSETPAYFYEFESNGNDEHFYARFYRSCSR